MRLPGLAFVLFAAMVLLLGGKVSLLFHTTPATVQSGTPQTARTPGRTLEAAKPLESRQAIRNGNAPAHLAAPVKTPEFSQFLPQVINTAYAENIPRKAASESSANPDGINDDLLQNIRAQKEELQEKQRQLEAREKAITRAEEKLNIRITELQQLESSIQQRLQDEKNIKNKKIKRLTAVYEGMKPDRAAPVISKMDLATVVRVFLLMDEKKVGKILSYLPPDKAVQISQALTRQISSVK
ncbi:MAG: hypothetical protein R8L58_00050 [Mariprofundaceae bacterium]